MSSFWIAVKPHQSPANRPQAATSPRPTAASNQPPPYAAPIATDDLSTGSTYRVAGARRLTRYLASDAYLAADSSAESKVEVVAYCRNIQNPKVLRDAIKGFRGHQVNYSVIDSCKVPPFPNDLFSGIDVRWLEMSNSTVQFHINFLHSRPTVR